MKSFENCTVLEGSFQINSALLDYQKETNKRILFEQILLVYYFVFKSQVRECLLRFCLSYVFHFFSAKNETDPCLSYRLQLCRYSDLPVPAKLLVASSCGYLGWGSFELLISSSAWDNGLRPSLPGQSDQGPLNYTPQVWKILKQFTYFSFTFLVSRSVFGFKPSGKPERRSKIWSGTKN